MAPKIANKRKGRGDDHSDASSGICVQDEPRRPVKRTRGKSLSRLHDSDDDAGRNGSRDFQSWAKWLEDTSHGEATKSKKTLKVFEQKIDKEDKQLRALLQKHENTLQTQHHKSAAALKKVYNAALQSSPTTAAADKAGTGQGDEDHSLLQRAKDLLLDSRSVIKCYIDMDAALTRHQIELPTSTLKQDKQDIKEILACGRAHGEKIAKGHLAPRTYTQPEADRTKLSGHQQTAADLFRDCRKTVYDGVGTVIEEQMHGFKQLLTAFPRDKSRGGGNC